MTAEQKPNLATEGLLGGAPTVGATPTTRLNYPPGQAPDQAAEVFSRIAQQLGMLMSEVQGLRARADNVETYVAYLLEKDPEIGPKIKEAAEKEAQTRAAKEAALQAAVTQQQAQDSTASASTEEKK